MDPPITVAPETYELLEKILFHVPMKQLFLRRVSKTWQGVIKRSQGLQKKMFLLADGQPLKPRTIPMQAFDVLQYDLDLRLNPAVHLACGAACHCEGSENVSVVSFPGEYCLFGDVQILTELPLKDLFVVQRVGTSWKELIERSETINTEMFLMVEGPVLHPVDHASTRILHSAPMRLQPALQARCLTHPPETRRQGVQVGIARLWGGYWTEMELSVAIKLGLTAVTRSVERMLLTQPPIAAVSHVLCCCYGCQGPTTIPRPQAGITFGDLIEVASTDMKEHVKTCETCRSDEWEARHQ